MLYKRNITNRGNCSGVVECTEVVREEVRRGADVIKFRQAGLPAEDPRVKMVESPDEIKAIIDTAHQLDRRVAVHTDGASDFLHAVIEAGADTIEHGPLDDKSIVLMVRHGTALTTAFGYLLLLLHCKQKWEEANRSGLFPICCSFIKTTSAYLLPCWPPPP